MAITADALVKKMCRGINLGQVFEADAQSRASWRLHKLLESWWSVGFRHVRIPTTWYGVNTSSCRLNDSIFMSQLTDTINYAVQKGFIVILNAHHENWLYDQYDMTEDYNGRFWQLWVDISTRFNYIAQDKLILEILNEPQGVFGNWNTSVPVTDPSAIMRTQRIMKTGFDGVRRVSPTRVIACSSNGMGNVSTAALVYPSKAMLPGGGLDRYLMMHVHTYTEWSCCGQDGDWSLYLSKPSPLAALHQDVESRFKQLAAWRDGLGGNTVIPVNLGEHGTGRTEQWKRDNDITRENYRYTTRCCLSMGIAPTVWDDGDGWFGLETIGNDGSVVYRYGLMDAIMSA